MKNSLSSSLSSIMADLDGSPADPSSDIRPQHGALKHSDDPAVTSARSTEDLVGHVNVESTNTKVIDPKVLDGTVDRPRARIDLVFSGGHRGEEVDEFIRRFELQARINDWTYERWCDALLNCCKDDAWRLLSGTIVTGLTHEQAYCAYREALTAAYAIEPMQAYRQLQQMSFDPAKESIDSYASNILRCTRVLFPDSMRLRSDESYVPCACHDYYKDHLASKAFWYGLRNYPRLSDLMTQWSNGQAIFAQAVRLVRVALSNTSDEPRIMLSDEKYDEKKKDEKQKDEIEVNTIERQERVAWPEEPIEQIKQRKEIRSDKGDANVQRIQPIKTGENGRN